MGVAERRIVPKWWRTETGKVWRKVQIDSPRCAAQIGSGRQCARVLDTGQGGSWIQTPDEPEGVWVCTQHAHYAGVGEGVSSR
jgi:hypothetical protein